MKNESIDDKIINAISFIQMSPNREKVLKDLKDELKIPTKISKSTGISTANVSRALQGLKQKKMVVCLNEEANQGRLYQITDFGLEILKYIK
ncbi:MAG: transcriptional regulator [Methanobacteriaceae archaeon]